MDNNITAPVLLIGFNRPEVIRKSFDFIRKAKPQKLYVAIDGARKNKPGEVELVEEVKNIVKEVDWDCETHYKFSEVNQGAEITVSSAVTWSLKNEEFVIVLEDDIIAPLSFLNFAQEMLIKYADNDNIYMISSNQTTPIGLPNGEDYLFGIYGHIWGWATWKRAWENFDLNINDFDDLLLNNEIDKFFTTKSEKKLWLSTIKKMKQKGLGKNTWDICWGYIRFKNKGLSIIPKVNLSSNIGTIGLHSKEKTSAHFRPFDENFKATKHPKEVKQNVEYDIHHFNNHINKNPSLIRRAIGKTIRILKLK
jgi:hypothetical protein